MRIELSGEQDEFIRRAVETGRFTSAEEAVQDALALWVERERERDELLAAIDEGEAALAAEEAIILTTEDDVREFVADINRRGRARHGTGRKRRP